MYHASTLCVDRKKFWLIGQWKHLFSPFDTKNEWNQSQFIQKLVEISRKNDWSHHHPHTHPPPTPTHTLSPELLFLLVEVMTSFYLVWECCFFGPPFWDIKFAENWLFLFDQLTVGCCLLSNRNRVYHHLKKYFWCITNFAW